MFSNRLLQNLLLGVIVLVLILALGWALVAGTRAGKSNTILKNVTMLDQGLRYFFNDQNRYPTSIEFQDRNLMLNYFTIFPPQTIAGGPCSETYRYSSPTSKTFELDFCLPKSAGGFTAGWNKITQ